MRIALLQGPAGSGDVESNLTFLERTARMAARQGTRLLVCPEMFLTGYDIGTDAVHRLAEPADGPSAAAVARIARASGVAIVYGWPERVGSDVYNAASLVDRDGRLLLSYRKTHLFGDIDTATFRPGDGDFTTVLLDDVRVGLLICYDVEFPETVRCLALAGADLVVVPTALMVPYDVVARTVVPTRAVENQVYLAYANRAGAERVLQYCGLSCVVGPDGVELARAGTGVELAQADLDLPALHVARAGTTYLADRRPELYAALTRAERPVPGRSHP